MADGLRDLTARHGHHSNILLLASPFTPGSRDWCQRLLPVADPGKYALVFVLATETPDARLQTFRDHDAMVEPQQIGFVNLRGRARYGDEASTVDAAGVEADIRVESVADAGDLTSLGIALTKLFEWADGDCPIALCLDSMTTLLQYVDPSALYRFLNVLTGRVREHEATAHYHLDPTAHASQEVNQFLALFDAVVEFDTEEEWRVRIP